MKGENHGSYLEAEEQVLKGISRQGISPIRFLYTPEGEVGHPWHGSG